MKIYTVTVVNSESWNPDGRESITIIGTDKMEVLKESWEWYENLNTEHEDIIESYFEDEAEFRQDLEYYGISVIQYPDHHIQFEYSETDI